jgi:hypothetical protein
MTFRTDNGLLLSSTKYSKMSNTLDSTVKSLLINSNGNGCYVIDKTYTSYTYSCGSYSGSCTGYNYFHYIFKFNPTTNSQAQKSILSINDNPWGMVFGSTENLIISLSDSTITLIDQANIGEVVVP